MGEAGEADRRGLATASRAVEGVRTDVVRNEAVAEAGRSVDGTRTGRVVQPA